MGAPRIVFTAAAGLAAAVAGKSIQNAHRYVVRRRELHLAPGALGTPGVLSAPDEPAAQATPGYPAAPGAQTAPRLRILHISDLHLTQWHHQRGQFLASLADLAPDFVVVTGDLIATPGALPLLLESLAELLTVPGAFVFGSNDYYSAKPKDPTVYLRHNTSHRGEKIPDLPTAQLTQHLVDCGWVDLNNARAKLTAGGWQLDLCGVNDPHMAADRYPARGTAADATPAPVPDLRIGLSHAPYQHVLAEMQANHCDLVFCGHTHGGQVCLPGQRALVTNCDLPPKYASGLFPWPLPTSPTTPYPLLGDGSAPESTDVAATDSADPQPMWVQVSAGIGTSPFTPFRVFCPPEAIVLDVYAGG